jgi:hypothetical protein
MHPPSPCLIMSGALASLTRPDRMGKPDPPFTGQWGAGFLEIAERLHSANRDRLRSSSIIFSNRCRRSSSSCRRAWPGYVRDAYLAFAS